MALQPQRLPKGIELGNKGPGEMNSRDVADLFWSDLSAFRVRAALQNDAPEESPLPELVTEQLHDSDS
jgi:hypothetical protein